MRWLILFLATTHVAFGYVYDDELVTCGSVLKLANANEGSRLHSHDVKYGSGSGQQSVTAVTQSDDVNSHWQIYPALKKECHRGDPIKCGDKIRLKHLTTGCFLHTHHFQAPLSKHYQEISCFGSQAQSDTGDNWQIVCNSEDWLESENVKIKHVETGVYLALSGQQFGRPIHGQREIVGTDSITNGGLWKAAEGVYMKKSKD
ncbi:MIR domain protein [Cooperia oncophora]